MGEKYLVVSVHDATPKFEEELDKIFSELRKRNAHVCSILAIPNLEGRYDISEDKTFSKRMKRWLNSGHEIVQHGYDHVSPNRTYKSRVDRFYGETLAQGSAEFQNIGYEEAKERIVKGKEILRKIGIESKGFVAPAWLMNPESQRAVSEEFDYTTLIKGIRIFPDQYIKSKWVCYTRAEKMPDWFINLYNRCVKLGIGRRDLARVAIHPQDLREKRPFEKALDSVEKLQKGREIVTYEQYVRLKSDQT